MHSSDMTHTLTVDKRVHIRYTGPVPRQKLELEWGLPTSQNPHCKLQQEEHEL